MILYVGRLDEMYLSIVAKYDFKREERLTTQPQSFSGLLPVGGVLHQKNVPLIIPRTVGEALFRVYPW